MRLHNHDRPEHVRRLTTAVRVRTVVAALLSVLWSGAVLAQDVPTPQRGEPPKLDPKPKVVGMRFERVREGPASACGSHCREWISASGRIVPETGRDFEAFAREHDIAGKVVVLESPGGAVSGGLALGRAFRRLNMTVVVGRTVMLPPDASGERRATYSPQAFCVSMCPFVLLGGVRRHVPPEARIMVHQIWPGAARADSTAATYTAQNVAGLLRGAAEMARYTVDMGGEIELFDITMRIPPWENVRALTRSEILRTRLSTTDTPFARPDANAVSAPPGVLPSTGGQPVPTARWMLLGAGADRGVARRHPLTIQGDEIGTFIVTFACGDKPETLTLRYWETRRVADADNPDVVARALVAQGRARIGLKVESSSVAGGRLQSIARGTVPMAFATLFAENGPRSVTLATLTKSKVQTAIRIGNTGFRAALDQLTPGCARP